MPFLLLPALSLFNFDVRPKNPIFSRGRGAPFAGRCPQGAGLPPRTRDDFLGRRAAALAVLTQTAPVHTRSVAPSPVDSADGHVQLLSSKKILSEEGTQGLGKALIPSSAHAFPELRAQ